MRLRTRLSAFFVATVATALLGFSAALYAAASRHLHGRVDDRLESALDTLTAAVEIDESGVEWEPAERLLRLGRAASEGPIAWVVRDGSGRRLDGSDPPPPWPDSAWSAAPIGAPGRVDDPGGDPWRVTARRVDAPSGRGGADAGRPRRPRRGEGPRGHGGRLAPGRHRSIVLGVGASLAGVRESLRNLAGALAALSSATGALALLIADRLGRRALRPVSEMAAAARAIAGHEFDERLPIAGSGDELDDLGRAFNGLLDRHRESHERQRRFAGDASHQLRTPLTAMIGQVDLALRQPRSADDYRRALQVVQGRARHLGRIVEALLFLARADPEARAPRLDLVDLGAWARDHLDARGRAGGADVRLVADPAGPTWARVQPTLLGALLDNLLDNAEKYAPAGAPIVVRVGLDPPDGPARIAVEDRGIGLGPDPIDALVEPFRRSDRARVLDPAGLGLGLAVAARIARQFGGALAAHANDGPGSTFALLLPAATGPPLASDDAPDDAAAGGPGLYFGRGTI